MAMAWRPLPPRKPPANFITNLPIYEECDSKFRIGFIASTVGLFNLRQAKDFPRRSIKLWNPKNGRNAFKF